MSKVIHAKVDGKVFVPEEPVMLSIGQPVIVQISPGEQEIRKSLDKLLKLAESFEPDRDLPTDGAIQHDHYLYGTPKIEDP